VHVGGTSLNGFRGREGKLRNTLHTEASERLGNYWLDHNVTGVKMRNECFIKTGIDPEDSALGLLPRKQRMRLLCVKNPLVWMSGSLTRCKIGAAVIGAGNCDRTSFALENREIDILTCPWGHSTADHAPGFP
jgi:hypothetical protein